MDFLERDDSQVAAFFANRTVLITGGTGFIGKVNEIDFFQNIERTGVLQLFFFHK